MKPRRTLIKTCILALIATTLATDAVAKSCLWKVTSATGTLYLQGSIHMLKADSYPLAPAIEQAYAASEVLVLEVDIAEMSLPGIQQRIMEKAMLPSGETIQSVLDAKTFQKLETACTQLGLPVAYIKTFKPWFASTVLTLTKMQKMGFDQTHGLDKYFHGKALADKKKVVGLERIDFQIDLFDSLSATNPNDFIQHTLTDLEKAEEEMSILHKAWAVGEIETIGQLIATGFEDYPKLHKTLLLDRNKRWFKTLNGLLEKPIIHMVVVGAGHLPGKDGLLELFKQKGYTVEQL